MNAISERTQAPVWASRWLCAAGIYNLLWGATTIAFPHFLFDLSGIDRTKLSRNLAVRGNDRWRVRHRLSHRSR